MAVRRRQMQSNEQTNDKSSSSKGQSKSKHVSKAKLKEEEKSREKLHSVLYVILLIAVTIGIGIAHKRHVAGMFERDRHFSHLSTLERELTFRTEMGLYYSYFKTMIESGMFTEGLNQIMYDNVTEYPLTINTLKRFNLYPEVVLAVGYRTYEAVSEYLKKPTKQCWKVNRGEGLSPVLSCEGLGEPSYFYIELVFNLNGIMMAVFFLFGTYLSGSMFGGLLTVASFFYNHGEATRVQWTPPLRESFAYPFLVIQMFLVTHLIKSTKPSYTHSLFIAIATISFMLPWQFAQFALLTQTVAMFATYVLGYIGSHKMKIFLAGQGAGFLVSFVLLFGNEMLLTSFFFSGLVTISTIVLLESLIEKIRIRILIWGVQGILLCTGTLGFKLFISKALSIADDAHIGDIFRSKFTDYKNFHTMLYTCAAEFDFMEKETPVKLTKTLLAPAVIVVLIVVIFMLLRKEIQTYSASKDGSPKETAEDRVHRSKPHAEVVYHLFQLAAFFMMALIIMRLKLFWTPHMCLVTSLLASKHFFGWLGGREKHYAIITVILACMSYQGIANLQHQWSIMGEFSNIPQEELVEWINAKVPKNAVFAGLIPTMATVKLSTDAVFAGPMPTMATVKLSTGRPIVNHPHYEDAGLRERTKLVYSMYSRKPVKEVRDNLKQLQVDYVVLEDSWCVRRTRPGCSMPEIWDIEDVKNRNQPKPTCTILKENPSPHFKRVFKNNVYQVLKIM